MGNERLRAIQRIRDQVPLPKTISELFDNGSLKPQYMEHRPATRALVAHHREAAKRAKPKVAIDDYGIQQALRTPLFPNQLSHRYPWAVMWLKEGKRYKKKCKNLLEAVHLRDRIKEAGVSNATVVSLCRSYYIPVELIGKLPRPWVWCPLCMKPRKFRRVRDETIFVFKKVPDEKRGGYKEVERQVALLRCPMCGCTNRNQVYRRSNQPFEVRKFKRGVTRARKRKRRRQVIRR